jgi:hypothetical protein
VRAGTGPKRWSGTLEALPVDEAVWRGNPLLLPNSGLKVFRVASPPFAENRENMLVIGLVAGSQTARFRMLRRTKPLKFSDGGHPSSDPTARLGEVAAELEDLLSDLSEAHGRSGYIWWELGTNPPAAITAGLASNRLEWVDVQPDWYEHPHHVGCFCFIRIQNGKIGPPGVVALRKEVERSILSEIAEKKMPMFFRGEFRLTEDEKHRRIIRKEMQAVFDAGRRRKSPPKRRNKLLEDAIFERLKEGIQPPSTTPWDPFFELIWDDCHAWKDPKKTVLKRDFSEKTIRRIVEEQLQKLQSRTGSRDILDKSNLSN